jgi:hypothetical protein
MVLGDCYILRVPLDAAEGAMQIPKIRKYTELLLKRGHFDPAAKFGIGWIYGITWEEAKQWCRRVYDSLEHGGPALP